jgi:hypothetical protein
MLKARTAVPQTLPPNRDGRIFRLDRLRNPTLKPTRLNVTGPVAQPKILDRFLRGLSRRLLDLAH